MNDNKQILIFSGSIRSGKTSRLSDWVTKTGKYCAGFLTPDINGTRCLLDLRTRVIHAFEVSEEYEGEIVNVGRFRFAKTGFKTGKRILKQLPNERDWVIIDEVGKLEVEQGRGFEPEISDIINLFQSGKEKGKLLLVIRDTLLEKAVDKYGLEGCVVLDKALPL